MFTKHPMSEKNSQILVGRICVFALCYYVFVPCITFYDDTLCCVCWYDFLETILKLSKQ